MGLYPMTSLELLCRQIERDNPGNTGLLNANSIIVLGTPLTNGLGSSGRNTRIKLNGHTGNGFMGRREFFYDRLDIGQVFKGIAVVFEANSTSLTYKDLLPSLNAQYGLGLMPEDLSNGDTALTYGYEETPVTLVIHRNSLAYIGQLSVIWKRTPSGVFPESGPGTKTMVIGDLNAGYFGVVKQEEMLSPSQFYDIVREEVKDIGVTPVYDPSLFWMKFALDGEFYFFPSNTLMVGASWVALNGIGAVHGDTPYPWVGEDNTGERLFFELELPRAHEDDPMLNIRNGPGSVSARILNKLHSGSYGTKEWDNLSPNLTNLFLWLNHYNYNGATGQVFHSQMNQATVSSTAETTLTNWRPMLKIVQGKLVVVPMRNLVTEPQGILLPPAMSIDQRRDPNIPLRVLNILATYKREVDVPVMQIKPTLRANSIQRVINVLGTVLRSIDIPAASRLVSAPLRAPKNVAIKSTLAPIVMQVKTHYVAKTQLGSLNGELSGFK